MNFSVFHNGFLRLLAATALVLTLLAALPTIAQDKNADTYPGSSNYLRGAYQFGTVLGTNDFLKGDNQSGQPIDSFQSLRLEFGWQTDGSKDWHHSYNFPSYGVGLYGADFNNDEELGKPTSLYGFFVWPLARTSRWTFNFELAFGFTNDWKAYDPVNNPKNVAMGLGRSVHIEVGGNARVPPGRALVADRRHHRHPLLQRGHPAAEPRDQPDRPHPLRQVRHRHAGARCRCAATARITRGAGT